MVAQALCSRVISDYALDGFSYRLRASPARIGNLVELDSRRA